MGLMIVATTWLVESGAWAGGGKRKCGAHFLHER